MFSVPKHAFIYLSGSPVDLRKGLESLAFISSSLVNEIPDEAYFVFLNRKRNRLKVLHWTSQNLSYWFIRSRKGVFAPKRTISSTIHWAEFEGILRGYFPERLMCF